MGIANGIGVLVGIGRIDGIHIFRHQDGIRLNFHAPQDNARIGGEVGIAGTGGKDHHLALV